MNVTNKIRWTRRLVWVYFWLLIFEGVLRKWVLPSAANALLVIRDPVVVAIYVLAFQCRAYPRNPMLTFGTLLAFLSLFAGLWVMQDAPLVALYGFRTDFLHLPLIFLIPKVFDVNDARKVGYWTLLLAVPMALLMVLQFEAPSSSWLNAGAGEGTSQIDSAMGHIRPAATFSYILGSVCFFAVVTAFLMDSQYSVKRYPRWLISAAAPALPIAAAVSGSRTFLVSVALVLACAVVTGLAQPRLRVRCLHLLVLMLLTAVVVSQVPIFRQGTEVLNQRVENAGAAEGGSKGFIERGLKDYTEPLTTWADLPVLGRGLGMGTNGGAAMLTGQAQFLLAEGEWDRVLLESGPILGAGFLLLRVAMAAALGRATVRGALRGNALPLLLFSGCAVLIVNGGWGQPTVLGFTVFVSGLCLAALRSDNVPTNPCPRLVDRPPVPSRSKNWSDTAP